MRKGGRGVVLSFIRKQESKTRDVYGCGCCGCCGCCGGVVDSVLLLLNWQLMNWLVLFWCCWCSVSWEHDSECGCIDMLCANLL